MKQATSFRLSAEALDLLRELAARLGVSQADAVELALRHTERTLSHVPDDGLPTVRRLVSEARQ